ncbi:Nanog homeobox [Sigmodon hispidus]
MGTVLPEPEILPCCEEAEDFRDLTMPEVNGPEENYSCLQASDAESLQEEIASPCPSSPDLPLLDSSDSSTKPKPSGPESKEGTEKQKEDEVHGKKQKMRTVFSQAQLCALRDRFQKQRYLSLQQMQELSAGLNLSYKQVKTWFQNQRMKCKRWQKNQWIKNCCNGTQMGSTFVESPSWHSSYPQGYLNTSGSLPMWGTQTWSNQTWTNPTWSNQTWNTQSWYSQAWNSQTWNTSFHSFGEDSLQPYGQYQQNFIDVEANLEANGESHNYFSNPQGLEFLLNHSLTTPDN